jgi:hypothetical protein
MNRLSARVIRLELVGPRSWRKWVSVPAERWPEVALLAFLRDCEGWTVGHIPTDAELRAIAGESDAEAGQ